MTKISIAIATFNEEDNLGRCLESVKWAHEIIIIDESSTDKTVAIAKKYTKKVFSIPKGENFHINKQMAIEKCTGEWILLMDADEAVSPDLKSEIEKTINDSTSKDGYEIPRRNRIFNKWVSHAGFYPDYQVRLFKNGKGKQPGKSFHEMIEIDGEIGKLSSDILHFHYSSIEQFISRMNRYTTNDAQFLLSKGESVKWYDAVQFPLDEFLKRFFFWEGYKDGLHGLILSILQSLSRAVVFAKIWEKQNFWEYGNDDFLEEFFAQTKKARKNWLHYEINLIKNPTKKIMLKIRNKLSL